MRAFRPQLKDRHNNQSSKLLIGFGLVVIGCLWVYFAFAIVSLKNKAWDIATNKSDNLLRSVEKTLERNIELYDLFLRGVVERLQDTDLESAPPKIRQMSLFDRASLARGYGSIFVLDQQGAAFIDSQSVIPRKLNGADRRYFKAHKEREIGLFIGRPWTTRVSGKDMIPLSRRLSYSDGTFAGVVVGAIELTYFEDIFKNLNKDSDFDIEMIFDDGDVTPGQRLLSKPSIEDNLSERDADRIKQTKSGSFISNDSADGISRYYNFSTVGSTPLHVNVSISVRKIQSAWVMEASSIVLVLAILTGAWIVSLLALRSELARRLDAEAELSRLVLTDPLTSIANRRSFDQYLNTWHNNGLHRHLAVVLLDVDHFKSYNDSHGHPSGDQVLKSVASVINAATLRHSGQAFRIGGEEFASLFTDIDEASAYKVAQELQRSVGEKCIPHHGGINRIVTVSVGMMHTSRYPLANVSQCLGLADDALYRAKNLGRNRVYASGLFLISTRSDSELVVA